MTGTDLLELPAGRYAPPFGRFGLLIDQALLHLVATRTAHAFLGRVAREAGPPSTGIR